jgi:hypothetical protein
LGGGHLGPIPFFVSVIIIFIGWTLRTSGKGLLQTQPAAAAEHEGAATGTATGAALTVEMPLTAEVAASLARQNARTQRTLLYVSGGCFGFFIALGAVLAAVDKTRGEGSTFLEIFSGLGAACACLIYGISWLTALNPVRRDLHGTSYLQTTGPVKVVPMMGGAMLRLADRAFLMNGRGGQTELSKLSFGRVDYSPHGHVILGVWDIDGRRVYCVPGYGAEST